MKKSEKISVISGISLLVLAALFLVSLFLQIIPLGNRTAAPVLNGLGGLLYGAYGFSSLLIPIFFFAAGLSCFLFPWSERIGVFYAASCIPFFTIYLCENFCREALASGNGILAGIQVIIAILVCILVLGIEYFVISLVGEIVLNKLREQAPVIHSEEKHEPIFPEGIIRDDIEDLVWPEENLDENEEVIEVEIDFPEEEDLSEEESSDENESQQKEVQLKEAVAPKDDSILEKNMVSESAAIQPKDAVAIASAETITQEIVPEQGEDATPAVVEDVFGDDFFATAPVPAEDVFSKEFLGGGQQQTTEGQKEVPVQVEYPSENLSESSESVSLSQKEVVAVKKPVVPEPVSVPVHFQPIPHYSLNPTPNTSASILDCESPDLEDPGEAAFFQDPFGENSPAMDNSIITQAEHLDKEARLSAKPTQEEIFVVREDHHSLDESIVRQFLGDKLLEEEDSDQERDEEVPEPVAFQIKMEDEMEIQDDSDSINLTEAVVDVQDELDIEIQEDDSEADEEDFSGEVISQDDVSEEVGLAEEQSDDLQDEATLEEELIETEDFQEEEPLEYEVFQDEEILDDEVFQNNNFQDENFQDGGAFEDEVFQDEVMENDDELASEAVAVQEPVVERAVPHRVRGPYKVPADELLTSYPDGEYWIIDEETVAASQQLKATLSEFKIEAEVTGIRKGPVITMFEILPAPGVKLSKIVALQDNIALRLAASSVRIVAPIPGKHAVGIEVPNKERAIVSFKELIDTEHPAFRKQAVPVVLGKDITGEAQVIDLAKTPHLLIAGSTGSGKSVCVNSLILSILFKRSPQEVRMILIDPKIVELKLYNDIPHLLTPVITEPKKAFQALQYCLCEMERRYALLDGMGVREITSYNKRIVERNIATEKLPYIVVIIDEFADLMATTGKELESTVARLAAMSRAVGIHLVLATQRPSIDVITGLIKANIPSRIAFMVASKMDSRIIIDQVGAEKLLGKGDMLYASATDPFPVRIQGTFVSDNEVENVVEFVKQYGEPDYIDDEIFVDDEEPEVGPSLFGEGDDPLYDQAVEIVMQAGKASASYIQRRLKIGYNRAARLVEEMEEKGLVGPANGSKPREIIHMP